MLSSRKYWSAFVFALGCAMSGAHAVPADSGLCLARCDGDYRQCVSHGGMQRMCASTRAQCYDVCLDLL